MKNLRKKNGFTLVELLAVIVVLAILMIVAFPAVLDVMEDAKKQNLVIFAEKVAKDVQTQYTYDNGLGNKTQSSIDKKYDIEDLNYASTGNYKGCVKINDSGSKTAYEVFVGETNYYVHGTIGNGSKNTLTATKYASGTTVDSFYNTNCK